MIGPVQVAAAAIDARQLAPMIAGLAAIVIATGIILVVMLRARRGRDDDDSVVDVEREP